MNYELRNYFNLFSVRVIGLSSNEMFPLTKTSLSSPLAMMSKMFTPFITRPVVL